MPPRIRVESLCSMLEGYRPEDITNESSSFCLVGPDNLTLPCRWLPSMSWSRLSCSSGDSQGSAATSPTHSRSCQASRSNSQVPDLPRSFRRYLLILYI